MKSVFTAAAAAALLILARGPASGQAAEYATTLADQQSVAVTIYNQDLALVKDRRTIHLPAGEHVLAFREVSAKIKPETALLTGDGLTVLEQNFEFDLLTPKALLEKYVGREVTVVTTNPATGAETRDQAKVLSASGGVVLQIGDHIETGVPGHLVFADVPENLRDRPTLTVRVRSNTDQPRPVELSYLTSGLGWQADYVAELNSREDALDINGWVTLTNQSGTSYHNASLQLVAGDIHQVPPEQPTPRFARDQVVVMKGGMEKGVTEEQMFAYHLYSLDRPTTIRDNQTKQVALLQAGQVPCRKELVLEGSDYYYLNRDDELGEKAKIGVFLDLVNRKENHLGLPLPKGVVRVYKRDLRDTLQFLGEDRIDHTPEKETLRLKLGDAFDVTAVRKQTDFKKLAGFSPYNYVYEVAFRIELKNGGKDAATVKVVEPVPGDWEMLEESLPHDKATSHTAVWQVPVPPHETAVLSYRVRVKY